MKTQHKNSEFSEVKLLILGVIGFITLQFQLWLLGFILIALIIPIGEE